MSKSPTRRLKTAQVNLKLDPALKAMAERMAADDNRSLTGLVESLITTALRERGYMSAPVAGS